MRLSIEHHYFHHPETQEIDMAVSKAFQRELDRLAGLVTADRSGEAASIAKAVAVQAEADADAIKTAHDDAQAALDAKDAAITELNDEIAALKAKLDELGAPPAPVDDPTTVQPVVDPATEAPVEAAAAAVDGSAPVA